MLTRKNMDQLNLDDIDLSKVQQNVATAFEPILQTEIVDGNLIKNIQCTGGTLLTIAHNLNRPYIGYFVVRVLGSNMVTVLEQTSPNPTYQLSFIPSATGTINLWVF